MATLTATIPNDLTLDLATSSSVVFSTANGNAIAVASDAATDFFAAIWVVNGTLTPAASAGVELVKTYNDTASNFYGVLLKGTAAAINAALEGMTYTTFSTDMVEGNVGYPAPWSPTGNDDMLMVYLKETQPADDEVMMDMAYMMNIDMHASADVFDPTVSLIGAEANATLTSLTSATFSWDGSDLGSGIDHYEYSVDGGTSWASTPDTLVTLSGLADGLMTFSLRAVDGAGNTSAVASDSWTVQALGVIKATPGADIIVGGAGNDILSPQHAADIAGDIYDGGEGTDTLKITTSMMGIDLPASNFDFRGATLTSIEVLSFNYMPMPMPGQVIFSSDQFGAGQLSNTLQVYGTWGSNDIKVYLTAGDSTFDASGWTFPVAYMGLAMGEMPTTEVVNGVATGNASSMWGHYIYQGSRDVYDGHDVGAGSEPVLNNWQHGVVYAEEAGDTIRLYGSRGHNAIIGTMVDDQIRGRAGDDTLTGGTGNDLIFGGVGNDRLSGAKGHDRLAGNVGNDILVGGKGNDVLVGGQGLDRLSGGAGRDVFVFNAALVAGNEDQITDFWVGKDSIHLDNAVFTGLAAGALDATGFVGNLTGMAEDAADRIIYETTTGRLFFDADGLGGAAAVHFATLADNLLLTHADFIVI